jgi:hypothetical protein
MLVSREEQTMPRALWPVLIIVCIALPAGAGVNQRLEVMLAGVPPESVPTGVLYDRVVGLSRIAEFDGAPDSPPATLREWRQMQDEIRRASLAPPPAAERLAQGVVPIGLLDFRYARLRPEALVVRDGRLTLGAGDPFRVQRVFAAAPLRGYTYRGAEVVFRLDPENCFGNDPAALRSVAADFDDGAGFVPLLLGAPHTVRYDAVGSKTIRLRAAFDDGSTRYAAALFEVRGLRTPAPNDTLHIAATIPYQGGYATGDAYVYLSDQHATLTEPVVVLEGFDLDNSMNWDELYALLNRQNLLETLRADGFDAVVLNFTDATDYLQRNAFVATELLAQVRATVGPTRTIALIGASMGGLVGRYALAYMETHGLPHAVRTFVSFDSPQTGADIPLGIQYWLWFFADLSTDAAAWLAALDSPAARQLLVYHHTDPPGATGAADPLRTQMLADFAAVGQYPALPRRVAVANGSGARLDQGFGAGAQIIRWEYTSFLLDITGNVWAVPDNTGQTIFHGVINPILFPTDEIYVGVAGTRPYDSAPGGWRNTMAQLDATDPGYGDIVALHPNHCFIPTVSALALTTDDLFYDVAGDPDILAHTPFDAVYFPPVNQEHVDINALNAPWFIAEIERGADAIGDGPLRAAPLARVEGVWPNPIAGAARVRFSVPRSGPARVAVYDTGGRRLAVLAERDYAAGEWETSWDGRDGRGRRLDPGVYFVRLRGDGFAAARTVTLR